MSFHHLLTLEFYQHLRFILRLSLCDFIRLKSCLARPDENYHCTQEAMTRKRLREQQELGRVNRLPSSGQNKARIIGWLNTQTEGLELSQHNTHDFTMTSNWISTCLKVWQKICSGFSTCRIDKVVQTSHQQSTFLSSFFNIAREQGEGPRAEWGVVQSSARSCNDDV